MTDNKKKTPSMHDAVTWRDGLLGIASGFVPILVFLYVIFNNASEAKSTSYENRSSIKTLKESISEEKKVRSDADIETLKYINDVIKKDMKDMIEQQFKPLNQRLQKIDERQYQILKETKRKK